MTVSLEEKYRKEREKRLNEKGLTQYLDSTKSAAYGFVTDRWIPEGTPIIEPVSNGGDCKIVIFGAGFAGLVAAVRCLETGAAKSVGDILIVDPAGGFGGTWYWNRYPGLMCDIESYIYLPLLEETGYMPRRKYSSGQEIREYAELLADKYGLYPRAMFQTFGKALKWEQNHWTCSLLQKPKGKPEKQFTVKAEFVILASGGFTYPKLPNVPGLEDFGGSMFHTARFNYDLTGGTQAEPTMTNLSDKRVAVVGTGATAIKVVPEVARYAKELFVFQRTPSAVDVRDNRDTDPEEWRTKIATKKGWQLERAENFQAWMENHEVPPLENLIDDGTSRIPTLAAAFGSPRDVTMEDLPRYIELIDKLDRPRSDKVRQRVLDIVKDQETAKALQAWYPQYCKRPCFHDEYLPAFNRPSVHLVDTAGKGIESLTSQGIVANGHEYPIDVIIWSTGHGSPVAGSLAGKAEMTVTGSKGQDMEALFQNGDLMLLHGIIGHGFPNLFSIGFAQAGLGPNQMQRVDLICQSISHILTGAEKRVGSNKMIIEPSEEACEEWGNRVAGTAHLLAAMAGCTPSCFTKEGEVNKLTPEQQMKGARSSVWGRGYTEYARIVGDWIARGDMQGLEVAAAWNIVK